MMVVVKVRETYDLHTTQNKMTVIGIHTPKPDIIKRNFPGLLMQCKAYRPLYADVRVACASVLPLDPLGVGTSPTDIAPEDVFNPILYKAMSNKGMSQLEARIAALSLGSEAGVTKDVDGALAMVDVDDTTNQADEFTIYYGLLSNAHGWRHANPQAGLSMEKLRPLVYELVYNLGDTSGPNSTATGATPGFPLKDGTGGYMSATCVPGKAKEFPWLNCTSFTGSGSNKYAAPGFPGALPSQGEVDVPWLNVLVGCIIVPPSRLHELFYRMVVEWSIEFSSIRPLGEITTIGGLDNLGATTHFQNYNYSSTKEAITGSSDTILDEDSCMVASNVEVNKVM